MKKKVLIPMISILLLLIVVAIGVWGFTSHSFEKITTTDKNTITSLECGVVIHDIEDEMILTGTYAMPKVTAENFDFQAMIDILRTTKYRPDFRNLLLGNITSVSDMETDENEVVTIILQLEDTTCSITFLSDNVVTVNFGNGYFIYHPTNSDTFEDLVEYIQIHGMKN